MILYIKKNGFGQKYDRATDENNYVIGPIGNFLYEGDNCWFTTVIGRRYTIEEVIAKGWWVPRPWIEELEFT